jgi:hypothetical protein
MSEKTLRGGIVPLYVLIFQNILALFCLWCTGEICRKSKKNKLEEGENGRIYWYVEPFC